MTYRPDDTARRGPALVLFTAGLALYLVINYAAAWSLCWAFEERGLRRTAAMTAYLMAGYVVFLPALLAAGRRTLALLATAVTVSVAGNLIYGAIFDHAVLTDQAVDWLVAERRQAPHAWVEFRREALVAVAMSVASMAGFLWLRRALLRTSPLARALRQRRAWVAVALAFVALHALPFVRPVPFAMAEASLLTYGVPALLGGAPDPRTPEVAPEQRPLVEKIVLVVDESVTYRAYRAAVAPVMAALPALDYGEARSTANCSASSNALLRWGVERGSVGRSGYDPRASPHLWGYARAAGLRTTLIDGQTGGPPQDFLTPQELAQIDEFVPALAGYETDRLIARMLNERLRRPGRELIYVVKRGAHFPFQHACADGVVPVGASRPEQHAAAVACSNDRFFELLTAGVDFSRVLLVYTSDHGQDFENTRSTHCNPAPRDVEYSVPLVVLTRAPALDEPLRAAEEGLRGSASHAAIFPTLLQAMGYGHAWIESTYGSGLASAPAAERLTLQAPLPFPSWREPVVQFASTSVLHAAAAVR